jgi:hypothetical protein
MTPAEKRERMDFVGSIAAEQLDHFSPIDRAKLYEGLSLIYTGERAKAAAFAAFTIRKAEAAQLEFLKLLGVRSQK